jgi:hypothetical protein
MRTNAFIAALVAGLVAIGPAMGQTMPGQTDIEPRAPDAAPADEDFSASHLAAAQDVIDLTRSDRAFDDILPRLAQQTQNVFTRSNPSLTREIEETVMDVALEMAGRRVELSRTIQLVWARRFSEAELDQLIEFFSSDLGQKFTELTPVITALSLGAARQWEEELSELMVRRTRERLREQGYAL